MKLNKELENISGEKIRRQYFNAFIYILATMMLFLIIIPFGVEIIASLEFQRIGEFIQTIIPVIGNVFVPIILLSMLNRFIWGKNICILNSEGLYYKEGFIKWNDIKEVEYEAELPCATWAGRPQFCYAHIKGNKTDVKLFQAPYFLLKKIKKYNPDIDVRLSKNSKSLVRFWIFFSLIQCLIIILSIFKY